jgi:hypothetical protein
MSGRIEHFIHGTPARLDRFRADLPDGMEVRQVADGLVLREDLGADPDIDAAIAVMEARAQAHGVEYDGHGQWLDDELPEGTSGGLDIQARTFTSRTGTEAGHGFAFPLPDGRFGHAIHLGSDRRGYLLLDVSALVRDRPASSDAVRDAPRRYRQPILLWHTPFAAMALTPERPLAPLPCAVPFRMGTGWPAPRTVTRLERRFAITGTDAPEGWNALLLALADAGERLPGRKGYSVWMARVGRTGLLRQVQDHAIRPFLPGVDWPMPWQPADMGEVAAILAGTPDMIAVRDKVT